MSFPSVYPPLTLAALPQEIIHEIFSHLTHTPIGRKTLKSCSRVCRPFLRIARAHLFRRFSICDASDKTRLCELVRKAPPLTSYIKELYINGFGLFTKDAELSQALSCLAGEGDERPKYCSLQEITLDNLTWLYLSPHIKLILLNLLASDSLRRLTLDSIEDCPASLVQCLSSPLKFLRINNTCFSLPFKKPIGSQQVLRLESLTINLTTVNCRGHSLNKFLRDLVNRVVDVRRLRTLRFTCDKVSWPAYQQMLQRASETLEHLHIQTNMSRTHFTPINLAQFPRLVHITISTHRHALPRILPSFHASITWLAQSLEEVPLDTKIDRLTVRLLISVDTAHGTGWDISQLASTIEDSEWERLDVTLSKLSATFRGIYFWFNVAPSGAYRDLATLLRTKLPRARVLKKLHIRNQ